MNKYELQKRIGEIKNLCDIVESASQELWRKCMDLDDQLIDSKISDAEIKEVIKRVGLKNK